MGHFKAISLDHISFENVSIIIEGLDPVLQSVDIELPMDQTVHVQSSNPTHAVHLLETLSGRRQPQKGRILLNESELFDPSEGKISTHEMIGCYFENQRPPINQVVISFLKNLNSNDEVMKQLQEHFELDSYMQLKFKDLTYEFQKLFCLIAATLKFPQMLILEDPALGLTENSFLNFLDWVQLLQRQGCLRHIFLTNNHPTALRHMDVNTLYLEDGLIYVEEETKTKKAVHF